jgi:hypothetical protein
MRRSGLMALFGVLALGMVLAQKRVDQGLGAFRAQHEALYVWKGGDVRRLCPGLEAVMADLYWLRTVQYFGGQRVYAEGKSFDLLAPLTEITVALDPRFVLAYHYGAIFLSEPMPLGAGKPREGIALLDRGATVTGEWRLRQYQGYFTFLYLKDPIRAADILIEASKMPGAAYWLKTMAADILMKSNERAMSRAIWQAMYDQADPGAIQDNAKQNLLYLNSLDVADALEAAVESFRQRNGRRPHALSEVESWGGRRLRLADASHVPFEYDESSGQVSISQKSSLWRLPSESSLVSSFR